METKRGPFDKLIEDAISSMDIDSDQKPVNVKTDPDKAFKEGVANAQKAEDIDFSKLRGGNNILNDNSNTNLNQVGSGYLNHEFEDQVGGGREPVNRGGLIRNKIAAIPIGGIDSDDYIKWFSELSNKDVQTAGGKGASLGEMFNSKFPVPPGFVITAQSFDYFMTKAGLKEKIYDIIKKVKMEDTEDLTRASKTIRKLIESEEIPDDLKKEILESYNLLGTEDINERGISQDALNILRNSQEPIFVSVRSSATTEDLVDASFAGQQESFLNVKGDSSLIEFVKKCFSSLYTPRAIYYRNKKGFTEGEALLAVVIQKMVDSEKSGVVFSRDPVRLDDNVVIEAVFGLGEGIVSGKIKPDHYVVSWDLKIKDVKIVNKKIAIVRTGSGQNETVKLSDEKSKSQVLTSAEVLEIANYAIKLEEHYKKPQDIEFATEGGEVYIVQSRPITTLGNKSESREISGNVILEGQSASPGIGSGVVKIIKSMEDLPKIKKGDILVTEMTNPDMVVAMQKSAAIVTDEGGMTSHAAIVSREMGIPCIVGTETATTVLKDGMRITVDGANGKVYEGEVAESQAVEIKPAVPTERIKIKVIVDLPDFAERAAKTGLDTVGLTRLEGIIASMKKHPLEYEKEGKLDEYSKIIEEGLGKILSYFKKVWFRASDVRTDEYSSLEGAPEREINPMLGFHGIRFSLKHPEILKAELNAMKRVAAKNPDKKIGIMFPQVILIEEVKEAKKYFNEVKLDNMEFGAMIETPAAVQIIEDICEEVDFISFGTNDLTQFTLAVDRNNEDVQYLYDELHPAIFSQIKKVIDACRKKNVETSICGQAGSKKQMAEFLFKKGISSISVNADAAYDISNLIKSMEEEWEKIKEERKQQEVKPVEVRRSEERNLEIEQKNQDISNIKTDDSVEIPKQAIEVQVTQGNQLRNTNNQQIRIENNQNQQGAINQDKINKKKEKWKRWKEKKKKWKEEKKKEQEEKQEEHWDKKARLGTEEFQSSSHTSETPSSKDNELVHTKTEITKDYRDSHDVPKYKSHIKKHKDEEIEKIDNFERVDDKIEDVKYEVALEKRHQLAERRMVEQGISVEEERLNPDKRSEEDHQKQVKEQVEEFKEDMEKEEIINKMKEDGETIKDYQLEPVSHEGGRFLRKEPENEAEEQEGKRQLKEVVEANIEEETGSIPEDIEDIGVYNPDKKDKEEKQKFNYNFDDFE